MSKVQKKILLGYCIIVFLLCVVWVPWEKEIISIKTWNVSNGGVTYAPIWAKDGEQIECIGFNVIRRSSHIDITCLGVELIAITQLAILLCLVTIKR